MDLQTIETIQSAYQIKATLALGVGLGSALASGILLVIAGNSFKASITDSSTPEKRKDVYRLKRLLRGYGLSLTGGALLVVSLVHLFNDQAWFAFLYPDYFACVENIETIDFDFCH